MGKMSVKENKNLYQLSREDAGLTREAASEKMVFVSPDRLVRIENDTIPRPDEVMAMADAYKSPTLCNYYCAQQCAIGRAYVPEIHLTHLSQIVLETLSALNTCSKEKDRLIEITADGKISKAEMEDFLEIQKNLNNLSTAVDTLKYWVDHAIITGEIEKV